MYTLNAFRRRLTVGDQHNDVNIEAGSTMWLRAQEHSGENIGDTETHVIFIELKEPAGGPAGEPDGDAVTEALGPEGF